jgi:hypothetical protein
LPSTTRRGDLVASRFSYLDISLAVLGDRAGFIHDVRRAQMRLGDADLTSNRSQHGARRSFFCPQHSTRVSHQTYLDGKAKPVVIASEKVDL